MLWLWTIYDLLLGVERQERQIEYQSNPVTINQEQYRKEGMYGCFGNDIGVESIAQIDRVDVITNERALASPYLLGDIEAIGLFEY